MLALLLTLLCSGITADMPTHCELSDLVGLWKFTLIQTPNDPKCKYSASQPISSALKQVVQLRQISTHSASTSKEPLASLVSEQSIALSFHARLSSDFADKGFLLEPFTSEETPNTRSPTLKPTSGYWSPIFDQGLMLKHFSLSHDSVSTAYIAALAYSAFECHASNIICRNARDFSNSKNGVPKPFVSKCSATLIGWAVTEKFETHCFRGELVKSEAVTESTCPEPTTSCRR